MRRIVAVNGERLLRTVAPTKASVVALALAGCAVLGCHSYDDSPAASPSNAVTQGTVTQTPSGAGIASATVFTFTAQGFSAPGGGSLEYAWNFGDGITLGPVAPQTATMTHTYEKAGTYDIWVSATSSVGAVARGSVLGLRIVSLTGRWGIRDATGQLFMENTSITQNAADLSGEEAHSDDRYWVTGKVSDPRRVVLTYTRLAREGPGPPPESFTFTGDADERITAFSGALTPGGSAKMVRCSQPSVCE